MIPVSHRASIRTACAVALAAALAAPAFAASSDAGQGASAAGAPTTGENQPGANAQNDQRANAKNDQGAAGQNQPIGRQIAQRVRDDLGKAGFTDIHIMPSSFLVRAKDSSGNPVMMVINPDSVTAITEEPGGGQGGSNAAQTGRTSTGGSQPVTPGAPTPPVKTTP